MKTVDSLYKLFDLPPTCTDDELRHAYRRVLLEHHPDRNPHQIESATAKTQEITTAYAELKRLRSDPSSNYIETDADSIELTIRLSFGNEVDLEDIANRKLNFRSEWERFRDNPSNPIYALRLVHAAFRTEQSDSVINLLLNHILIDSASLLFSIEEKDEVYETILRWAQILVEKQHNKEAVQILEDAFAIGQAPSSVKEELRSLHYSWAQYNDPTTGKKATPEVRATHFGRILELGFEYDYIYKLLAEAYHELGDDEQAHSYLSRAYQLNPELEGAVRISRILSFSQFIKSPKNKHKEKRKYKWTYPEQVPSSTQIVEWAQEAKWDTILEYANPKEYFPRILPKARDALMHIAEFLENCKDSRTIPALIRLLRNKHYWDVSKVAMTSLSKIGDKNTLDLLKKFKPEGFRAKAQHAACISYLQARLDSQLIQKIKNLPHEKLLTEAKHAYRKNDYGLTRVLLENSLSDWQRESFQSNSASSVEPNELTANSALIISQSGALSKQNLSLHKAKIINQTFSSCVDAIVLLAKCCAQMDDTKTAVELIKSIFAKLSKKSRHKISSDVAPWLWDELVFQDYIPINDEDYKLALEIHLELALSAMTPDDMLQNLHRLTRWLEMLGEEAIIQELRRLIQTEAPGTIYVDQDNRERYIRNVHVSQDMEIYLIAFEKRIKAEASAKLKQIMKGSYSLETTKSLLNDH